MSAPNDALVSLQVDASQFERTLAMANSKFAEAMKGVEGQSGKAAEVAEKALQKAFGSEVQKAFKGAMHENVRATEEATKQMESKWRTSLGIVGG